jgi:hypothetical protein
MIILLEDVLNGTGGAFVVEDYPRGRCPHRDPGPMCIGRIRKYGMIIIVSMFGGSFAGPFGKIRKQVIG